MNAITGPEKTMWKWTRAMHIEAGKPEAEAENLADKKIESMRALSKRRDIIRK
jgi:DNA replicative helicase MCM subunit Mcm2 (Cdc46/Mcm family)